MSNFAAEVARSMSLARASSPERCGTLVRLVGLRMEARGMKEVRRMTSEREERG